MSYEISLKPSDLRILLAFVLEKDIPCVLETSMVNFNLVFVLKTTKLSAALDLCMKCIEKNINYEVKYV